MTPSSVSQFVGNTKRFHEIASVLAKHGLAGWLKGIDSSWVQEFFSGQQGETLSELPIEVRLRLALTELGTTFIKLGQVLSTRPDLVGPEAAAELSKLQSSTPADSPEVVRGVFIEELGKPPEELFESFSETPLASASIAQAHKATTHAGEQVVVKVQHAGITDRVRHDLDILAELAGLAERFSPDVRQFQPIRTVDEFKRTLLHELDFRREAANVDRFVENFSEDPMVRFPKAHGELSGERVLTMDFLEGTSVSKADALRENGYDLADITRRGAGVFIEMIFRDGFYHADPHPGNLMVLEGGVIGVLDCGMVGRINEDLREQIEEMMMAAVGGDSARLTQSVVALGQTPSDLDRQQLESEIADFLVEYRDQSVENFDLSGALEGIVGIVHRHRIILPARLSMLLRVLVMLEGTSKNLSPDFSLAELLGPYRQEALKRRLSPERLLKKLQSTYTDWNRLVEQFPNDATEILSRIKHGTLDVQLEHRRLEETVNRLVVGILTAALFMGSATLWSREAPPVLAGFSVPGACGCLVAAVLGFRLLRSIRRGGR